MPKQNRRKIENVGLKREKKTEDVGEGKGKGKKKTKKLNYLISDSVSIDRKFMPNNEHIHSMCMYSIYNESERVWFFFFFKLI